MKNYGQHFQFTKFTNQFKKRQFYRVWDMNDSNKKLKIFSYDIDPDTENLVEDSQKIVNEITQIVENDSLSIFKTSEFWVTFYDWN